MPAPLIRENEVRETQEAATYALVVFQFVGLWVCFLILITATVLILNIDWSRPQVEQMLSQSLARKVVLGALNWRLGLNGLAISTQSMQISGQNGTPLLKSGASEIGIAFLPILSGKLIIRHVKLRQPEIWAIRLHKSCWNFSDLFQPGLDIRFLEIEHGLLHLRNQATDAVAFAPRDFQDLKCKLTLPKPGRRWPLFLSFKMPRQGYTTSVVLTTIGQGALADWQSNEYRFNLKADKLNARDLQALSAGTAAASGLYDLNLSGSGVLLQGIHGDARAQITDMSIPVSQLGLLQAKHATASVSFNLAPEKLAWKNFILTFGAVEIHASGSLSGWQQHELSLIETKQVTGQAEFQVMMRKYKLQPGCSSDITASKSAAAKLLNNGPLKHFPWLLELLTRAYSKLHGEVKIEPNQRVDLPEAEITSGASGIDVSGFWDKARDQAWFKFSGRKLDLKELFKNLVASPGSLHALACSTGAPENFNAVLTGSIDLKGICESSPSKHSFKLTTTFHNAGLTIASKNLHVSGIEGQVDCDGSTTSIAHLSGKLGHGKFQMKGVLAASLRPSCNITFDGQDIDLNELGVAMQLLKLQIPLLSSHQLYGHVSELSMDVLGQAEAPLINLSIVPDDLYYQAPGVAMPLRAAGGTITYKSDRLKLKEVPLISHGDALITSLTIDNLSASSNLRAVKVKTSGIDLADVHFYLASALMPPALRKQYQDFVARFNFSQAHGKAYGNMFWQGRPGGSFNLEGTVGLVNTSLRAGSFNWPFEHLSGIFAASGNELLIQDVSGYLAGNKFVADGHVTNYRADNARWQTELKAQINPQKALSLLPGLNEQMGCRVACSSALALRAILAGDLKSATAIFALRSSPGNHLRITAPFGLVSQPDREAIVLDGSLVLETDGNAGQAKLNNANLIVGSSLAQAKGTYCWSTGKLKGDPIIEFQLKAPNPIPAQTVAELLSAPEQPGLVAGSVTGELSGQGPIDNISSRGYLSFNKVTFAPFNLYNLTGIIETPSWSFDGLDLSKPANTGSRTNLHIDSAGIGALEVKAVNASVVLESPGGQQAGLCKRLVLQNGRAQVAGGLLVADGWTDLTSHRTHLSAQVTRVAAGQIAGAFTGHPGEVSGWADASLVADSTGDNWAELMSNLDGTARIKVESGKVAGFGQLQERLAQASLLQGGILGFNLNNLVQSVLPVKTGQFKDLDASLAVAKGIVKINELKFNGDDMHLLAAGTLNPALRTMALEVTGNVPRVSSSILSEAVGAVSRGLSIQKLLSLLTMHKLESLPPLPILGQIADDRPRNFSFHVVAPMDNAHLIGQSIQRSFRWLK